VICSTEIINFKSIIEINYIFRFHMFLYDFISTCDSCSGNPQVRWLSWGLSTPINPNHWGLRGAWDIRLSWVDSCGGMYGMYVYMHTMSYHVIDVHTLNFKCTYIYIHRFPFSIALRWRVDRTTQGSGAWSCLDTKNRQEAPSFFSTGSHPWEAIEIWLQLQKWLWYLGYHWIYICI
jgi:hypothetical protein